MVKFIGDCESGAQKKRIGARVSAELAAEFEKLAADNGRSVARELGEAMKARLEAAAVRGSKADRRGRRSRLRRWCSW